MSSDPLASGAISSSLEDAAAALYSSELQYHNFGHALETVATGERIVARCREEGIRIDPQIVYLGLLFHDAGYRENHAALGFETKEAYSAHLAGEVLAEHDFRARTIEKVQRAILSTYRFGTFRTAEQKAVRAADLAGLAADFDVFRANSVLLHEEYQMLSGKSLTWEQWIESTTEIVRYYLRQEIRLTSYFYDENRQSAFHRKVAENLARLRSELDG